MRFQASGQFLAGQTDVDPAAAPNTILLPHLLVPRPRREEINAPSVLKLALLGTGAETLTVSLYGLVEDVDRPQSRADLKAAGIRWTVFATGVVVTNGAYTNVTSDLPIGGILYARRTADTITALQTRALHMAWGF